jgi:hypothetical protein
LILSTEVGKFPFLPYWVLGLTEKLWYPSRLDILGVKIDFERTKERSAHARLLHDAFGEDSIPFIFKECTKVPRLLKEIKTNALDKLRVALMEEAKPSISWG